jgi:hypothetical protein
MHTLWYLMMTPLQILIKYSLKEIKPYICTTQRMLNAHIMVVHDVTITDPH